MKPNERYAKFLEGMGPSAKAFEENWQSLEAQSQEEVLRFREILKTALDQGSKRNPKQHHVFVHEDWIEAQAHHRLAAEFLMELRAKVEPCIRLNGIGQSGIVTVNETKTTGFLNLNGLEKLFEELKGYNPGDHFRLHGGLWHACLTQSALQLSALSMGKWWPGPDIDQLKKQRILMANSANMNHVPVRFGLAMSIGGAYEIFKHAPGGAKVCYKFEDEETEVMPKSKKPNIRWQSSLRL